MRMLRLMCGKTRNDKFRSECLIKLLTEIFAKGNVVEIKLYWF